MIVIVRNINDIVCGDPVRAEMIHFDGAVGDEGQGRERETETETETGTETEIDTEAYRNN